VATTFDGDGSAAVGEAAAGPAALVAAAAAGGVDPVVDAAVFFDEQPARRPTIASAASPAVPRRWNDVVLLTSVSPDRWIKYLLPVGGRPLGKRRWPAA